MHDARLKSAFTTQRGRAVQREAHDLAAERAADRGRTREGRTWRGRQRDVDVAEQLACASRTEQGGDGVLAGERAGRTMERGAERANQRS